MKRVRRDGENRDEKVRKAEREREREKLEEEMRIKRTRTEGQMEKGGEIN